MKIKIYDCAANTARVIEYPLTLLQFIKIHWGAWGFYRIEKAGANCYNIFSKFDGAHVYTACKAGKNEPVTE